MLDNRLQMLLNIMHNSVINIWITIDYYLSRLDLVSSQ